LLCGVVIRIMAVVEVLLCNPQVSVLMQIFTLSHLLYAIMHCTRICCSKLATLLATFNYHNSALGVYCIIRKINLKLNTVKLSWEQVSRAGRI